jgi:hypothetical protein
LIFIYVIINSEYRKDRGHWVRVSDMSDYDFMVDHIGPDGIAVAGFFINSKHYENGADAGSEEQQRDPLFREFEKMAKDQSWLAGVGPNHKTWTFGYGHDKTVASALGCEDIGEHTWDHACVIVTKTSADGRTSRSSHSTHFGHDHTKKIAPTASDIRNFVKRHAAMQVEESGSDL